MSDVLDTVVPIRGVIPSPEAGRRHHAVRRGRLMSIESVSTTTYMIAMFLLVATLNSVIALFVTAIAAICRINQNKNPELFLNNLQLYIRSWTLSAVFLVAAYFGYGLYSLLVILVLAKPGYRMTNLQTVSFTLVAGILLVCINLVLGLGVFYLGG